MNIKLELLREHITDYVRFRLEDFEIDVSQIANTTAIMALGEIQKVIKDENYSDFDAIEEIVCIFEKYKISAGFRHDF
ncbi:MAG: hypothetical protein E7419_07475 [Ruminococcaceae bacterium]|nr:hypothetical protein [Oscillospiraceae bacterium]